MTGENAAGARTTYIYDSENQLINVKTSAANISTYSYAGDTGLRRTKQEPGGALTTIVWDGDDYLQERS